MQSLQEIKDDTELAKMQSRIDASKILRKLRLDAWMAQANAITIAERLGHQIAWNILYRAVEYIESPTLYKFTNDTAGGTTKLLFD